MSDLEPPILNTRVYLNYLTPEIGAQYEVFRNVQIFTLGVYVCDVLYTVPEEVKMMRSRRFTVSICAYWIAKTFAFVNLTLIIFSTTGPVNHCQQVLLGAGASFIITAAATSFLFLERVRAVFFNKKSVHWFFSALWLATIVTWVLVPIGVGFAEIADTKHCVPTHAPRFLVASYIMPLIYDSLVFLAISYKIITSYSLPQCPSTWRTLFCRSLSHRLPRAILHGGQQYYLVSVCVNIIVALLFFIPTVPQFYRTIMIDPGMVLTSTMACRVFRNLFLLDVETEGRGNNTAAVELTTVIRQTGVVSGQTATSVREPNQDTAHAVA